MSINKHSNVTENTETAPGQICSPSASEGLKATMNLGQGSYWVTGEK